MNVRPPRSPRGRIPHARLFGKRLRMLRSDAHIAHLLKQNLELKALVRALAEKYLAGKSRTEVRRLLHEVLLEQRRIYNEALSRQAIKEARSVDELLLMLDEIKETDLRERGPTRYDRFSARRDAPRGADGAGNVHNGESHAGADETPGKETDEEDGADDRDDRPRTA